MAGSCSTQSLLASFQRVRLRRSAHQSTLQEVAAELYPAQKEHSKKHTLW